MKTDPGKTPKIIAVVGPTASGKSALAIELAQQFDGEIVSADSRQVYRGLDITTGKVTENEMAGIPHHLLSVASPKEKYTAAQYQRDAERAINQIFDRDRLPILCGGTGFYVEALTEGKHYPEVAPNPELREKLDQKSADELFTELTQKAPKRARTIDPNNRRRLVRALEIHEKLGKIPQEKDQPKYNTLQIGLDVPDDLLEERIAERTRERLKAGMLEEARKLISSGVSLERLHELGLDCHILAQVLEGKITEAELPEKIQAADRQYAKKQETWFQKKKVIDWFDFRDHKGITKKVRAFLKQ